MDRYSFLLPHVEADLNVTPNLLLKVARSHKKSACGADAWSMDDLAVLPWEAWRQFLAMITDQPHTLIGSLTSLAKRAPIAKVKGQVCRSCDVRLLDIYSSIFRVLASACVIQLRPWIRQVFHPAQFGCQGGVLKAVTRISLSGGTSS